jgi:hypothetical protein
MSELWQIQVHVTDALRCSHRVHTQHAKLAIGEKASTISRISESAVAHTSKAIARVCEPPGLPHASCACQRMTSDGVSPPRN